MDFCNAVPATTRSTAAPLHTALKPNLLAQRAGKPPRSLPRSLTHPPRDPCRKVLASRSPTHPFYQPHVSLPSILEQHGCLSPASGHFFHPSLAYRWALLITNNQGPDLPSEFLTVMYFRGAHKRPHSAQNPPSLTHEGQQFNCADHRLYKASLEGTSWTLAGLRWRWPLSLEWRAGSPRNEALRMKPQRLPNQQTGGLNVKTQDSKGATWCTASHTPPQKCDHLRITWSNYKPLHSWADNVPPPGHGLSSTAADSPQQRNSELRQTPALL